MMQEINKLKEEGVLELKDEYLRLPLPAMKKTGIGLKSYKGTKEELEEYLKTKDSEAEIRIEQSNELFNLYFSSEPVLEKFLVWLKGEGHKIKIYNESLAKEYYRV